MVTKVEVGHVAEQSGTEAYIVRPDRFVFLGRLSSKDGPIRPEGRCVTLGGSPVGEEFFRAVTTRAADKGHRTRESTAKESLALGMT